MKNEISFRGSNGSIISLVQYMHDFPVRYTTTNHGMTTIPAGDMVMLLNLYQYIKDNDIQNDFINPNGKNKEA